MSAFDPGFDDLPGQLPIFPLTGVLLLPRGELPLNIFEPRYLNMTLDAIAGDRLIGMIQPTEPESEDANPPVYSTGCAGRIVSFQETEDSRLLITLKGLCRFNVKEELPLVDGYRPVVADWSNFRADMESTEEAVIDRERLLGLLKTYFKIQGIEADWNAIETTSEERLVTCLSMICPFEGSEKQALLEAPTLTDRGKVLITLVEMAVHPGAPGKAARQ